MDLFLSLMTIIASIICVLFFGHLPWIQKGSRKRSTLPEAAGSWPIIGHLHLLAGSQVPPYMLLSSMADKFGPIFTIKLGVHRVLVVSSSEMAKECLTTNDKVFASRPKAMSTELMSYNYANFAFAPYGPYWREMRKIVVLELMSHRCLQMLARIQASEVNSSIIDMYRIWMKNKGSSEFVKIDMTQWFGNLMMNMVVRMVFGNCFLPSEKNEDVRFKKAIRRFGLLLSVFVPSDVIPGLWWLDFGGYKNEMKTTAKELDIVINKKLEEYYKKVNHARHEDESEDQVLMAAWLSRVKELKMDRYGFSTDAIVKATCLTISAAGIETTTVTLTWALALLVNNPLELEKAQQELENNVGKDRKVEASDLKKLVYLEAIIKETMRLYPAGPLSLPHDSIKDCVVGGYTVPKGTRLLVNIWKIQHDPQVWTDPFEFQPERFLTNKKDIDVKGQHFELIPFGSGRRICVGMSFALDALQLILANILHGFEFRKPSNELLDMTVGSGLTNPKATPLDLLVAPRLSLDLY